MKVEYMLVQLSRPVDVPDMTDETATEAAEIASNSLRLHGGNLYPVLPGGKLDTFLKENFKEELT